MRYVGLLSGGKDSCFNLLHCAKSGHQLIAAASLGPGPGKDEIDSYLYQTVGQDAIQLVADALEIPLIRRVITGDAVQRGSEYGSRLAIDGGVQGDETEDLLQLLLEVKTKFPDVQGVSVGAILSNYQRVRVEHVCQRLSLTPLCYLWQRDQAELLTEMIDSGLEAILIKVAGIGLTSKHLGKSLLEMQPTLVKLNSMYGAHICGEGGEYESLTLDLPLFKHRIRLETVETVIHSDNEFATVAYLKVKHARLERKSTYSLATFTVPSPPILDDIDERVHQATLNTTPSLPPSFPITMTTTHRHENTTALPHIGKFGPWVVMSNVESTIPSVSVEEEVRICFVAIQGYLAEYGLDLTHIANITLLISSMELFPAVNAIYASYFGASPPARVCVAVDLPPDIRLRLECIAYNGPRLHERQPLHVQSLSYWAPANIGPYSQAIKVGEHVFVSGQIGLVPSNNSLPSPQSLAQEVALSMRHARSVSNAMRHSSAVHWDGVTLGAIFWLACAHHLVPIRRGVAASETFGSREIPTIFVTVKSLPKDALIETQVLLHSTRQTLANDDDEEEQQSLPRFSSGQLPDLQVCWEASYFDDMDAFLLIVTCMNHDDMCSLTDRLGSITTLQRLMQKTISVRCFLTPAAAPDLRQLLQGLFGLDSELPPVMAIPSRVIATWGREDWDYALCFFG
ncbi:hypothetical protein JB92DRAFT_2904701 [Gautieria morchelliformis]|nr:hypothetical protein JB92DRAFT_2904701 [Gautieria morchelliformis]